uniref:Dynein axonemal intermediate chain 7 n=1 Tax=Strix occidentalis caurina TaxID=311401 RepID=A0A8D0FVV4_STROC
MFSVIYSFIPSFVAGTEFMASWEQYLSCDGSPDPTVLQEINTSLIKKLQFLLLDTPPNEITEKETIQYQESILELQNLLHQKYNGATEHLLKTANMYEDSETGNMQAVTKDQNVTLRSKNHVFCGAQHGFDLPKSLALSSIAVHILHTHYDHVSPLWLQCQSVPKLEVLDSKEFTWHSKDNVEEPKRKRKGSSLIYQKSSSQNNLHLCFEQKHLVSSSCWIPPKAWPGLGGKEPREYIKAKHLEETNEKEEAITDKNVVDLQQLVPVGGVYHIDALQLPPQVKQIKDWILFPLILEELFLRCNTTVHTQCTLFPEHCFHWFVQQGNQCMLSSVVVEEKDVLSHITGKWISPVDLRGVLKKTAVNIFPVECSHKYVSVNKKVSSPVAEVRAYQQMALVASAFAWSKWNLKAGQERVVFCQRQRLSLCMFNGQKAQKLKITKTSEAFSEELGDSSEFHFTLYHMLKDFASKEAIDEVERASFLFIDVVYQLLLATRVLTHS